MKQHLSRYLSKDVVDRMIQDPAMRELGGNETRATVLFADIRRFTTIAEALTAAETMNLLNGYFAVAVPALEAHGGFVDKIIGDAVMAVFGVPFAKEDDAIRAVRAGIEMQSAVKKHNASQRKLGMPPIRIGIGVNTGEVISGNLGCATKMDYTVIGDGVNISARLEGLTKEYGIPMMVTESTREEIFSAFETLLIDDVLFKGKLRPVKVYQVIGEKGAKLTDDQKCFQDGLEAYRNRNFRNALQQFNCGPENSRILNLFTERCEHYLRNPPGEDWDGFGTGDQTAPSQSEGASAAATCSTRSAESIGLVKTNRAPSPDTIGRNCVSYSLLPPEMQPMRASGCERRNSSSSSSPFFSGIIRSVMIKSVGEEQ